MILIVATLVMGIGCDVPGAGTDGYGDDLLELISPRRIEQKRFGESLDGNAATEPGADLGEVAPFMERRSGAKEETSHVLYPFVSTSRSQDERSFALRPLFASRSSPGKKQVEVLWPLMSYRREAEDRTFYIRPIFYYKRRVRTGADRETDTDWSLFPLVFGGNDNKEGPYFAIFPLGGVLKGQLGKKQISFFLWPLWTSTKDVQYESINVMWPMISLWRGKDQSGRRLWPFFGANRREGRFDRRFYLWPIFATWKTGLDSRFPGDSKLLFPLYGRVRTYRKTPDGGQTLFRQHTTVLWPLFSHLKVADRNLDEIHMPWPFIGVERADGLRVRKLWPIWGERKSNDRRDKFVLWPLYRRSIRHEEDMERRTYNVALIFTNKLDVWAKKDDGFTIPPAWPEGHATIPDPRIEAGGHKPWPTAPAGSTLYTRRWVQLWPLFHYRRDTDKHVRFQFLSLFTARSAEAETLWGPFYTLYKYERDENLEKRESFLFGMFRHFRRPEKPDLPGMRYVDLAGVVSYHRRTGISKKFSILGGFIGYERVGHRRAYRFLWAPFGRIPSDVREQYEARAAGGEATPREASERTTAQ